MIDANYAFIKTADGDEIQGLKKEDFQHAVEELECKKLEKNDRIIYLVKEEETVDGINYFASDYIEKPKEK